MLAVTFLQTAVTSKLVRVTYPDEVHMKPAITFALHARELTSAEGGGEDGGGVTGCQTGDCSSSLHFNICRYFLGELGMICSCVCTDKSGCI